jgi:D-alanyl-D-alanine carboxypeptidase/D-alanyl-D-alanine-endopeptidase (penicillin-binding protein 4)
MKVISLESGETLYERDSKMLVRPASNMKLITSATALVELGLGFKFKTLVFIDGTVENGVLGGNVYAKGFGNPDFNTEDLRRLVGQVAAKGIKEIRGDIIADKSYFDSLYWGNGWMWDDEPSDFAAFISPLSINDNCIRVFVKPGSSVGRPAQVRIEPLTDYVKIMNHGLTAAADSSLDLSVDRLWKERENTIVVEGRMPLNRKERDTKLSVWGVEKYFLYLMKEEMDRQGIKTIGKLTFGTVPVNANEIARHEQPIDSMIINLNKISDNLSAENTLKTIGAEIYGTPGSAKAGVWVVNRFLDTMGIDTTECYLVDGSGVSHYNLVTPDMYVTLLRYMYNRKDCFGLYFTSLPIANVDGTLRGRMKGTKADGNLHAKTGTIGGVSTLSGYVKSSDGEWLAFSIMMQNFIGSSQPYRDAQDKVGAILADFSRKTLTRME